MANVARELQETGHEPAVLCPDTIDPEEGRFPFPVMTITCPATGEGHEGQDLSFPFPCFTTHPRSNRTFYALNEVEMAEYEAVLERRSKEIAADFGAEVIHAQHLWVISAMARRTGLPYVVTSHGTDLLGYRADHRYRHFAHEGADGAQMIAAVSEATRAEVFQHFGIGPDRLLALPNGVDQKTFHPLELDRGQVFKELGLPPPAGPVVIYAGKLACFKGTDVLLDAASIYERQVPDVVTVIAGGGAERNSLENMARALHVRGVRFAGFLEQDQLVRLYAAADVAVVPSREEPFGLAALEAMACGLPVVASRVGGLPEYVDDSVGRLVPPEDSGALAAAIAGEINSDGRKAKGPAATARGATYTWRKHADRLVEFFEAAVKAGPR